jgi:hypothetical protein
MTFNWCTNVELQKYGKDICFISETENLTIINLLFYCEVLQSKTYWQDE